MSRKFNPQLEGFQWQLSDSSVSQSINSQFTHVGQLVAQ